MSAKRLPKTCKRDTYSINIALRAAEMMISGISPRALLTEGGVTDSLFDFTAPTVWGEWQFDNPLAIATAISGDYSRTRPQRNEAFPDFPIPLNQQEA